MLTKILMQTRKFPSSFGRLLVKLIYQMEKFGVSSSKFWWRYWKSYRRKRGVQGQAEKPWQWKLRAEEEDCCWWTGQLGQDSKTWSKSQTFRVINSKTAEDSFWQASETSSENLWGKENSSKKTFCLPYLQVKQVFQVAWKWSKQMLSGLPISIARR